MRSLLGTVKEIKYIVEEEKLKVDDKDILSIAKDVYLSQYKEQLKYFINSAYGTRNFVNNALKGGFTYADTDSLKFTDMNPPETNQPQLTPAERFILKDGGILELLIGDIVLDPQGYIGFFNGTHKSSIYITCAFDVIGKMQDMHRDIPEGYAVSKKDIDKIKLVYSPTRDGVTVK